MKNIKIINIILFNLNNTFAKKKLILIKLLNKKIILIKLKKIFYLNKKKLF